MDLSSLLFNLADVRCEQCQAKLKWSDVQSGTAIICGSCKHEMPIEACGEKTALIRFDKNLVRPSDQVVLQREGSISILKKRWRTKYTRYVAALALIWNALALGATVSVHREGIDAVQTGCLLVFGIVGCLILIRALQELFNTTTIMLKNDKVVVGTGPIFGGGMKIFRADEIASFTVWRMDPDKDEGRPHFAFGVDLHTNDGRLEKLCPANNLNEAIYIEKTIEELLHIESGAAVDQFAV